MKPRCQPVSLSPSHRLGQNSGEEPPVGGCGGGSQELNINNPTADCPPGVAVLVSTPWSECLQRQLETDVVFGLPSL